MSRIATRFAQLKADGRGALVTFLTGFDPDRATSLKILQGLPAAGADVIEIGVPFTDPIQGDAMARFALTQLNVKKAAILYAEDSAYGHTLADAFETGTRTLPKTIPIRHGHRFKVSISTKTIQ